MAFTTSGIFKSYVADALGLTASFTPHLASGGDWHVSLYNNSGTPDNRVASANAAYNAGQWVSGNQTGATDANWPAGGLGLVYSGGSGATGTRWTSGTGDDYTMFDADDLSGTGNVTFTTVYGDLVFDDSLTTPVAKQALAFHYFGGQKQVSGGTFSVIWHTNGVARWTHTAA